MTNEQIMREAFEAFAEQEGYRMKWLDDVGCYDWSSTHSAFKAFKAGVAHAAAQEPVAWRAFIECEFKYLDNVDGKPDDLDYDWEPLYSEPASTQAPIPAKTEW